MTLSIGTKVRIIDPHNYYHGRTAWIEGDNEIERVGVTIDPGFYYYFYVITPNNEGIEHGYVRPEGIEVIA